MNGLAWTEENYWFGIDRGSNFYGPNRRLVYKWHKIINQAEQGNLDLSPYNLYNLTILSIIVLYCMGWVSKWYIIREIYTFYPPRHPLWDPPSPDGAEKEKFSQHSRQKLRLLGDNLVNKDGYQWESDNCTPLSLYLWAEPEPDTHQVGHQALAGGVRYLSPLLVSG